jgi:hypothetical protein
MEGGKLLKQDINDCISNLENHVHGVFASVRVSGEDFVYCPSAELFTKLDDYCDEMTLSEVRPPLLIKGEEGTGKSALLSNWLHRREHSSNRSRVDEFIFWHAVGCSRPSLNVNHLLRRLISGLKVRFELARHIPRAQERLSWELPRFLDLASKKGKIVIIIDGIHQLKTNDGSEDTLSWLPLELPPNVRMILSATANINEPSKEERNAAAIELGGGEGGINRSSDFSQGGGGSSNPHSRVGTPYANRPSSPSNFSTTTQNINNSSNRGGEEREGEQPSHQIKQRKNRVLAELERRKIPFLSIRPLERSVAKTLINTYIESTISSDAAAVATGPYLGGFFDPSTAGGRALHTTNETTYGFLLFESQINSLLDHSLGGNPQFLRLFLKSLHFVSQRGYSLWSVFEDWIQSSSVADLLTRILRSCEAGFKRSRESSQHDCDLTIAAGGAAALKALYSWHPAFKDKNNSGLQEDSLSQGNSIVLETTVDNNMTSNNNNTKGSAVIGGRRGDEQGGASGLGSGGGNITPQANSNTNKGDDDLLATGGAGNAVGKGGEKTLSSMIIHNLGDQDSVAVERLAQRQLQKAVIEVKKVVDENWNFRDLNYKTKIINNAIMKIHNSTNTSGGGGDDGNDGNGMTGQILYSEEQYAKLESRVRALTTDSLSTHSGHHLMQPIDGMAIGFSASNDNQSDDEEEEDWEEASVVSISASNRRSDSPAEFTTPKPSSKKSLLVGGKGKKSEGNLMSSGGNITPVNEQQQQQHNTMTSHGVGYLSSTKPSNTTATTTTLPSATSAAAVTTADPSEGFFSLPLYMRGGSSSSGFGDNLGNALSLLYVARQGLKEQELWKILDYLQVKAKHQREFSKEKRQMLREKKAMMRRNAQKILEDQALIEGVFRSEDIGRSGYLPRDILYSSLGKFVEVDRSDLDTMIDLILGNTSPHLLEGGSEEGTGGAIAQQLSSNGKFIIEAETGEEEEGGEGGGEGKIDFIHYEKFFIFLTKVYRKFHSHSTNSRFSDKNIAMQEEEEGWKEQFDDDYDNFHVKDLSEKNTIDRTGGIEGGNSMADLGIGDDGIIGGGGGAGGGSGGGGEKKMTSLGPVVEELLLNELCALGILYSPENKVLILPCDSDLFRQTIYDRYILPRGGGNIQYWHNLIIQYFKTQPNSLRKCEEMPWHLKICRKWTSLKDSLVDLKTFDLMFNNDLRDELMEYWLLLTEGPLYVTDTSTLTSSAILPVNGSTNLPFQKFTSYGTTNQQRHSIEDDNDGDARSTFSHILREIDESIALKQPLKDIRKKMFSYQMQPFDVVEELNRSVEAWVTIERPSPFLIHRTISQIAVFLLEFAKQTKSCPQFRRLGIDIEVLSQFGISLQELNEAIIFQNASTHMAGTGHHSHGDGITGTEDSPSKKGGGGGDGGAGGGEGVGTAGGKGGVLSVKSPEKKYFDGLSKKEPVKFPTSQMVASSFYLYLRWIWIQFPWLALHLAATVHATTSGPGSSSASSSLLKGTVGDGSLTGGDHHHAFGFPLHNNIPLSSSLTRTNATPVVATGGGGDGEEEDAASLEAQGIHDPVKHLLRVWNVKKADPSVQVFSNSLNRKLAAIKPRTSLSASLERNVSVSYKNLCEELTQPSHIAQMRLGLGVTQRDKFRRSFKEEVELTKNIPFSYHGVRANKTGSLFPTYHTSIKESNRRQFDGDDEGDVGGGGGTGGGGGGERKKGKEEMTRSARMMKDSSKPKKKKLEKFNLEGALKKLTGNNGNEGGMNGSTFFLTELDDEIRRLTNDEYLQSHRMDRGGLIKDETDLEYESYLDRVARMKGIWNKLLIIEREKERIITELENAIILRQESDTILINEVQSGEALIKTLNDRNVMMEKNLREAVILEEGYKELIKCLKLNPPYVETHVAALELEVSLAEKQFNDLCLHRAKLYQESIKLEEVKKKQLQEKINYFKTARQEIATKKKGVLKEVKHLKEMVGRNLLGNDRGGVLASSFVVGGKGDVFGTSKRRKTHLAGKGINGGIGDSLPPHRHKRGGAAGRHRNGPGGINNNNGGNGNNGADSHSDNDENEIIDTSDSDDSSLEKSASELPLTKPVMHFINALVRKVTYNEPIIKETDATVHDVKKRAAIAEANQTIIMERRGRSRDELDDDDLLNEDSSSLLTGPVGPNPLASPPGTAGKGGKRGGTAPGMASSSGGKRSSPHQTGLVPGRALEGGGIGGGGINIGDSYDSGSVTSNGSLNRFIGGSSHRQTINHARETSHNATVNTATTNTNTSAFVNLVRSIGANPANVQPKRRFTVEQISKLRNIVKLLFVNKEGKFHPSLLSRLLLSFSSPLFSSL